MTDKVQLTSPYKVRFVSFGKQYNKYKEEIDAAISRVLNNGKLILQEDVEIFEEKLAKFVGTKYAIGVNSGTDALYLSLLAAGVGKGDEVLVPSHTFVATLQVVRQLGANLVVSDVDDNGLLDAKVWDKVKYILPVHIAGQICGFKDTVTIEDACQAFGAVKNPTSLAQCWSFYPAKILGCFGDGGAVTTNSKELADEIKELRNHYKKDYSKWGINSRLDNLQAAVLSVKIDHIDEIIQRRQEVADMYYKGLESLEKSGKIKLPSKQKGRVYQDFILKVNE